MKLGVALSGGGVRSAAQLGIMQALMEKGIKPEVFAGTSGGAIVATLLALGNTPNDALLKFKKTNEVLDIAYWHIFKGIVTCSPINGLYKGNKLQKVLDEIFGGRKIGTIPYNIGIVTASIDDGQQIIFSNSFLPNTKHINDDNFRFVVSPSTALSFAVSASTRLPAVFMPLRFDYYDFIRGEGKGSMNLVDGGIVNNLPSDVAIALGAERVISIDLGYTGMAREIRGLYPIVKQTIDIAQERIVDSNMRNFDIYLNPEIFNVKVLELEKIDECFERGYEYGKEYADSVIQQLGG